MSTIYQHPNGRYYLKFRRRDGKEQRFSLNTKSKGIARKKQAIFDNEREARSLGHAAGEARQESRDCKIVDFLAAWEKWATPRKSARTVEIQRASFNTLVRKLEESGRLITHLSEITPKDVRSVLDHLLAGDKPKSNHTVNGLHRDVRALFNHARALELFTGPNPATGIKRLKTNELPPPMLTMKQADALLDAARALDAEGNERAPRMEWFVLLCLDSGLRLDEAVNSRWSWLDFDARTVTVPSGAGFVTKSSKSRTIPMTTRLRDALSPHRPGKDGFLFTSMRATDNDKARYRYDPRKRFAVACERAGVPEIDHFGKKVKVTPHVLRYTFGSLRAQRGVSFGKLSKWLGHHSVTVTEKHYLHLVKGYDKQIEL